jgi:hypothetical protein
MSDALSLSGIETGLTTVSRIYCGLSKPDGSAVTPEALDSFVNGPLAQTFPDGFSVLHADGGWRDMATGQTIREPSAIFEVAHGSQDAERVREVARAYKAMFDQQAVMVASVPVVTQFV